MGWMEGRGCRSKGVDCARGWIYTHFCWAGVAMCLQPFLFWFSISFLFFLSLSSLSLFFSMTLFEGLFCSCLFFLRSPCCEARGLLLGHGDKFVDIPSIWRLEQATGHPLTQDYYLISVNLGVCCWVLWCNGGELKASRAFNSPAVISVKNGRISRLLGPPSS